MLRQMLEFEGYTVVDACDGSKAIELYRTIRPDLVITDLIMPDKEGIEMIVELRKNFPGLKVIAISGGGRTKPESYLNVASVLGAQRTFAKPFRRSEMLAAIKELLNT